MRQLIISLLLFVTVSYANIINVPADFSTIQGGIGAAYNGDTVLVQEGTYFENGIRFFNKNLVVGSLFLTTGIESYITTTVIDGDTSSNSIISFIDGENPANVLIGFTITNGGNSTSQGDGGGIYISNASSPTLENLIVSNNQASGGGGIFCGYGSNPTLTDILIVNNEGWDGGGLYCSSSSSPTLTNVTFIGNTANKGGAIKCMEYSNPTLTNVTISGNIANNGGGLFCIQSSSPNLLNTIFWNNSPEEIYFSSGSSSNTITIAYSDIQGGQNGIDTNNNGTINWLSGNIDAEPQFCNPYNLEFTLAQNSPCVGTGESGANMGAYGIGCDQPVIIIHVPADYPTIQLGLNNASSGDIVLVAAGTYYENIIWPYTSSIKLFSSGDTSNTFINGNGGNNLYFSSVAGGDTTTLIKGFTIENGAYGIRINSGSAPRITNCLIRNVMYGIKASQISSLVIRNVVIREADNEAAYFEDIDLLTINNLQLINNGSNGEANIVFSSIESDPTNDIVSNIDNLLLIRNSNHENINITGCDRLKFNNLKIIQGYNTQSSVNVYHSENIEFENCLFLNSYLLTDNNKKGINIFGYSNVSIINSTFIGHRSLYSNSCGVSYVEGSSYLTLLNSNFHNNRYGLYSYDSQQFLDAENNWWGHPTGPYHPTSNTGGQGDSVNIYVDALPFLIEPDTIAPPPIIQNVSVDTSGIDYVDIYWNASLIGDLAGYKVYLDGVSTDVGLDTTFTISNLTSGVYYYVMVTCYDNSGEESWYSAGLHVSPISVAIIEVADTLDYGSILVGDSSGISLLVSNNGTADLNITNITSSASEFEPEIDTLVVSPSSQGSIPITFTPTEFGLVTANLTITSDANNTPDLVVTLIGSGDLAPNPAMISVVDVPEDQGGQVRVTFARSKYDGIDSTMQLESYTVWRHIDGTDWDAVGMFNAVQDSFYYYVATTLCDSTFEGICWSTYKVSAHTDDADIFFYSDSMSGYSVDNISPEVPTGLLATAMDESIELSWNVSPDEDFHYFILEKSTDSEFTDYETNETIDTTYNDTEYELNVTYYYRLAAADYTGNLSGYTETVEAMVLSINADGLIPDVYALHQNYPNPFNPITKLQYDLPENSYVNVTVYDMLGREIRTLVNTTQEAGFKSIIWDATNNQGNPVSAGVYLYKIQAGEFVQTKKMVLLK